MKISERICPVTMTEVVQVLCGLYVLPELTRLPEKKFSGMSMTGEYFSTIMTMRCWWETLVLI